MTQADFTIANQTFPNTRAEINTSLQALATNSAGNSAPSTTFASQWWFDSDGNQLYIRNKDNDAWVKVVTIGATSDKIESIADSISIASTGGVTITTADNTDTLSLISTDADASQGSNLRLYRNSSSPADSDLLGTIDFEGRNNNSEDVVYAKIKSEISAVADGNEFGVLSLEAMRNGTLTTAMQIGSGINISVADNSDNLTLISTDADDAIGANLRIYRNSSSPADADNLGTIDFEGRNDNSEDVVYAQFLTQADDVSDGNEDGIISLKAMTNGTSREFLRLSGNGGIVFNELSQDIDFRVESDSNANQFKVDAGANYVSFGTSTTSTGFNTGSVLMTDTRTTGNFPVLTVENDNASFAAQVISTGCLRSATASFTLYEGRSGNGSNDAFNDIEFKVNGEGALSIDAGSVTTGGADYAEMFEWKDGNSSSEDRRGYSVVLDGNQVVKATDSDDASKIIGVVSALPVVIGDSDIEDKWKSKYLKDDFGQHIKEEITITEWTEVDAEGNKKLHGYESDRIPSGLSVPSDAVVKTVDTNGNKFTRKKLNPDWDSSKTYIRRQDRKEWDAIGLMGKLRMLKGQPTGTNWIKMRDISSNVEEWLVR